MSFTKSNTEIITHINDMLTKIFGKLLFVKCDQSNPISDIITKLKKLEFSKSNNHFQNVAVVGNAELLICQSIEILKTINIDKMSQASQTYLLELKGDINEYISVAKTFINLPENMAHYLNVAKKIKDDPEEVERLYYENKYSHKLFAMWLQYCLDHDKHDKKILLDMVERAKDSAISGTEKIKPYDKSKFPAQRFRMIPIIRDSTISMIAKHFFGTKSDSITKLVKCANTKLVGVIVMSLITPRPFEYNIENLVDAKKVKKTFSLEKSGVSLKTLDRFALTKFSEQNGELWYNCERFCNKVCKKYFMIRTLNGETWDAMNYFSCETANKIMRGMSPRILAIQRQNNELFSKHLGKPIDDSITIKSENKTIIDELIHRITNILIEYIDKSLTPLPTSKIEIENVVRNPKFIEILNTETLRSFSDSGIEIDDENFGELMGTFTSVISGQIVIQFSRALKINMIERGPKLRLFKESNEKDLQSKLYAIFVDVIKFSVDSVIRSKENIFEKIIIKSHILNLIKKNYI